MIDRKLTPGTAEYNEHLRGDVEHYNEIYNDRQARQRLMQPVPSAWVEVETRAQELIKTVTGLDTTDHVTSRLAKGNRMLSLGCGPGGVEIVFAERVRQAEIVCVDVNPDLLALGRERSVQRGLNLTFEQADLNTIELPERQFDLVFCHAALHHVIELERLADQIKRTLRPDGEFIVVDVITANGYQMWPGTREIVRAIWQALPARCHINHTAYDKPRADQEVWEADTSEHSMECIRSGEILPVLSKAFATRAYVPYFSLCRRFFDTMYGPNYDMMNPLDRAFLDWIWHLDAHYISTGRLRPESFFGIYAPFSLDGGSAL